MNYKEVIESKYNRANWQELLYDIFRQRVQFWQQPQSVSADESMAKRALYTGKITLPDGHIIAIYEVELSDNVIIERNRAGIRNLLCANWRGMGCSGAFMFCFRQNEAVLRFSYVSESFAFAEDGSLTKEGTDTKRFTYLLGDGHRSRTAIKQFEDLKKSTLDLRAITKAFSVEALSDLFFKEYKKQYEDIIEFITGKRMVKVANKWEDQVTGQPCREIMQEFSQFPDAEKAVRDYVKKLMGRLVFIQFLQKKGWMGCSAGEAWNDGDKEFVQNLFANSTYKNTFVDDVLEPLFNDINTKRNGDIASSLNVGNGIKIPYLNGGLFENDDYDKTSFPLPAKYMKNLLDFFASYNFTIDENDPDDAEIGVDPEMLGRIFENLLEDNKDKGAFYTPKEIVQYMCRESLIAYLQTDVNDELTKAAIRQFVTTCDTSVLSVELKDIVDQKLKDVKICDPAIGSGAFPMGLLRELYACRKAIEGIDDETAVSIKTHIIQNNIYGVDIEKGAVDIARLRFWLALIVDEKNPHALPNMDFKIMQGNSLLEQYEGVELSGMSLDEQAKKKAKAKNQEVYQQVLALDERYALENIQKAIKEYYNTDDHSQKEARRKEINDNVKAYIKHLRGCTPDIQRKLENLPIPNNQFFLWHIYFKEVFDKGGFDIVIGNPPYVDIKGMPQANVKQYFKLFSTCENRINLYAIFIEKAIQLLSKKGVLCFINPNSMLVNESYTKLRKLLLDKVSLIVKLPDSVFETAVVETIVFLAQNGNKSNLVKTKYLKNNDAVDLLQLDYTLFNRHDWKIDEKSRFNIFIDSNISAVLSKVKKGSKPLGDYILTSLGITPYDKAKGHSQELIKNREYHSTIRIDDTYVPLISGKNISPYSITSDIDEYLKYGEWLGAPREKKFFTNPRIVVRQIVGGPTLRIIAGYADDQPTYFTQIGFSVISKNDDTQQLKFLLSLLNSRLISFYHKYMFLDIEKVVFQKILIANAKLLPVKIPTQLEPFITLVDRILSAKKLDPQADTTAEEHEIDRLVYDLYGLTEDEIAIVEGTK